MSGERGSGGKASGAATPSGGEFLRPEQLSPQAAAWLSGEGWDRSPLPSAGKAGSGRRYYRARLGSGNGSAPAGGGVGGGGGGSAVVMVSPTIDTDFHRFVQISGYLCRRGVEVPLLHLIDTGAGQIVMDDFGEVQLHRLLTSPSGPATRRAGWRVGLECLDALQRRCDRFAQEGPELLLDRSFDFKAVRWETDYFSEHYLQGVFGMGEGERERLIPEFELLAARVARHPQVLMHRDFQSQNLMVIRGVDREGNLSGEPLRLGVIDYQGARSGSCWYDLASLLWDPYAGASSEEVMGGWEEWCRIKGIKGDAEALQPFIEASLQRLMQACGAYGRLGHREGIPFFKQWILPGARQLQRAMALCRGDDLPELRAVIDRLPTSPN